MRTEAKVGFFVFLGLIALFLLSTRVNDFVNWGRKGYTVYALTDTALGLETNAKVKMNGVDIGYLSNATLEGAKVKLALFIDNSIQIPVDSEVSASQESVLGTKFVNIYRGKSPTMASAGQILTNERHFASMDDTMTSINGAATQFRDFIQEVRQALDEQARQNLRLSLENFKIMAANLAQAGNRFTTVGDNLNALITENRQPLNNAITNVDGFFVEGKGLLTENRKPLNSAITNADGFFKEGTTLVTDNKKPLTNALTSIDTFFKEGTPAVKNVETFFSEGAGTMRKIDKYIDKMTSGELRLSLAQNYMLRDSYASTNLNAEYLPAPTRYYIIGASTREDHTYDATTKTAHIPGKHEKGKAYLNAQFGKRLDDTRLRAGIIENTGGVGVDYYTYNDRLKSTFELYDFNARNDARGTKPHAKAQVSYNMRKHLDIYGGYDNALNSKAANLFMGLGVSFIDDDLKYLLGTGASFAK